MMLKIDDEVAAPYAAHAEATHKPLLTVVEQQLARFAAHPPDQPVVVLTRAHLQQLETLLGGGTLKTAADLVARTKSYASITLGRVVVDFTPAQKSEITHRAQKQGKTPDAIVKELVDQFTEQAFWTPTPVR